MKTSIDKGKKARKRLIIETIGVFLIIISPFVFKAHDYFSRDPEATINFLGMTIDNNGFNNINAYAWYFISKIIPLYLLIIWFFTCKHWWYHIILIPLCMYAFQLFEVVISDDSYIDTENVLWILPICMVVIPFVYFIRVKLYDKYVHGIDLEAMDAELKYYREKERQANHFVKSKELVEESSAKEDMSSELPRSVIQKLFSNLKHSMQNLLDMIL